MGSSASRLRRLGLLLVVICAFFAVQGVPLASAAPGSVLKDLAVPNSVGGVSVAFDGKYLYYTNLDGAVLHRVAPSGAAATDIPIVGAAGINALSYDALHDVFWGVDRTGLAVYRIDKSGVATPQFTLIPAFDLPGLCDVPLGCNRIVSGLAYDATDSLWYAPQGSERVYHFATTGQLLGYFDTDAGPSALVPDCLTNSVSGLAAGQSSLFLAAGGCGSGFQYAKSDSLPGSKLGKFSLPGTSTDVECDDLTYAVDAMWVRSSDGHLRAIEIPAGMCPHGGGQVLDETKQWMSGSGVGIGEFERAPQPFQVVDVPHTLFLFCGQMNAASSGFSANWKDAAGNKYSFRLTRVTTNCFSDGTTNCEPLDTQCFNVIVGDGVGKLYVNYQLVTSPLCENGGTECGVITFDFHDNGPAKTEPVQDPPFDIGSFVISDLSVGVGILNVCGCETADYRAHWCPNK